MHPIIKQLIDRRPSPKGVSLNALWDDGVQSVLLGITTIQPSTCVLYVPDECCCDMTGAVRLGLRLCSGVRVVLILSSEIVNAYVYNPTTQSWDSYRGDVDTSWLVWRGGLDGVFP